MFTKEELEVLKEWYETNIAVESNKSFDVWLSEQSKMDTDYILADFHAELDFSGSTEGDR